MRNRSRKNILQWERLRPPVIIVGAHRSGTSATAHALRLLGLQLGHILDSHDEPRPLQRFHEDYLRKIGASWFEPERALSEIESPEGHIRCFRTVLEMVHAHFAETFDYRKNLRGLWLLHRMKHGAAWGWKEPRTTLFARVYLELFPEARILHIMRDPAAAGASIQRRELEFRAGGDPPNGNLHELEECTRVALAYSEAGAALEKHARHYHCVRYEDLQREPLNTLRDVATFCGLPFNARTLAQAAATIRP